MRAVSQDAPILRPAARVLLIDDQNRLLLLCARFSEGEVWIMPGGTLEPGETIEQAAARQLWEETGVQSAELGPCVWTRVHQFEWGGTRYEQHERFFVVRVTSPTITLDNSSVEELQLLRRMALVDRRGDCAVRRDVRAAQASEDPTSDPGGGLSW